MKQCIGWALSIWVCLFLNTLVVGEELTVEFTQGEDINLDLSPDGAQLVMDLLGSLWLLPREGGQAQPLTDTQTMDARRPQWSPDGNTIAFQALVDGRWHIWTLSKTKRELAQVTQGPYNNTEPNWHPDGNRIVFASDRNGQNDIYEISLSDAVEHKLTDSANAEFAPAWSPNGNVLAYVQDGPESQALILHAKDLSPITLLERSGNLHGLSWHPGGQSLTFVHMADTDTILYLTEADRDRVVPLSEPGDAVAPSSAVWVDEANLIYVADKKIKLLELNTFKTRVIEFIANVPLAQVTAPSKEYNARASFPKVE